MEQSEFIQHYGPLAQDIADKTGLDQSVVLGQMAQESSWGNHFVGNNPYGISNPNGSVVAYPDIPTASQAYVDLINKRYGAAAKETDPDKQALSLQVLGYNNHAGYGATVGGLAKQIRGMQAQGAGAPTSDALTQRVDQMFAPAPAAAPADPDPSHTAPSAGDLSKRTDQLLGTGSTTPPPPDYSNPQQVYSTAGSAKAADMGIPTGGVATPVAPPSVGDRIASVGSATGRGFLETPPVLTPEAVQATGYMAPVVGAANVVGTTALGVGNALFRGTQKALEEGGGLVGGNTGEQIGRDLGATLEVLPALHASPLFTPPSEGLVVRPPEPNYTVLQKETPPLVGKESPKTNMGAFDDPYADDAKAYLTRREQHNVNQTAAQRRVDGVDNTDYLMNPDVPPPLRAEVDPSQQNLAHYNVGLSDPATKASYDAIQTARNDARVQLFDRMSDPSNREMLVEHRDIEGDAHRAEALDNATRQKNGLPPVSDVDLSGVGKVMDSQLNDDNLQFRPAVARAINQVRDLLFDKDGNQRLTTPAQAYAARNSIGDMLDKKVAENAGNQAAKSQLMQIRKELDASIDKATTYDTKDVPPNMRDEHDMAGVEYHPYRDYLERYQANSRPIDQIDALRAYRDKIVDVNGQMQFRPFQRMMQDLVGDRTGSDPFAEANGISVGFMDRLWDLRNDLARKEALKTPPVPATMDEVKARINQPGPVASIMRTGAKLASGAVMTGVGAGAYGPLGAVASEVPQLIGNRLIDRAFQGNITRRGNKLIRDLGESQLR